MSEPLTPHEMTSLLHTGGVKHVVNVPRHLVDRVVQRLTHCIEHDHTHVFVVDQSGGKHVRVGVSEHGLACVSELLGRGQPPATEETGRAINRYPGPDGSFGEHDDYRVGDEVWTYDNAPGTVVWSPRPSEYNVEGPDHAGGDYRVRTYDASRLALVRRKS